MGGLGRKGFEGIDDSFEVAQHDAVVVGQAAVSVGLGGGDKAAGLVGLTVVGGQELDGGLEVGACETSVGVRAVLLWWSSTESVGKAGLYAGEVVLDPLGLRGRRVRLQGQVLAVDVDAGGAPRLEGFADGGVVQVGVGCGHLRAGVAEESLHDMLGHALVDQACPVCVAELMRAYLCWPFGAVVQFDRVLPAAHALA